MSVETVEQAIVYVLKNQKSFILAEAEAALAKGDADAAKTLRKRIDNMGFGVAAAELTDEHEEARVDELFEWIQRFDQNDVEHTETNQRAYTLLRNDEDLFLV